MHSVWREDTVLTGGVWDAFLALPPLLDRPLRSVAILGNAAGTTARALGVFYPDARVDGVELDPAVSRVGREYFGMDDNPRLTVHDADARPFLRRTDERYDLIIVDAYHQPYVPFYLATREFFRARARAPRARRDPGAERRLRARRRQPARRDRRHARRTSSSRSRSGRRSVQQAPARVRRAGATESARTMSRRSCARSCSYSSPTSARDGEGEAALDGRPRPGRVGDRPDDRRVRRARRRARRGLPADAAVKLLREDGPLIRVGHRGAATLAPENTLRSFEAALDHGVDAIEFDVLDAADGPARARPLARRARPRPGDARRGAGLPRRTGRRPPRRPEADDTAGRGRGRARPARRRRAGGGQLVPPAEPARDRCARAAHPDRLHLSRGPVRRLEAPRDEAGDPARHARAPAGGGGADLGDDRARRREGADAPTRGRLVGRGRRAHAPARPSGPGRWTTSTSSPGSRRQGSMQ